MSIFDPAFHQAKKKMKSKQESAKVSPAPKTPPAPPEQPSSGDEVQDMLSRMRKMHEDLNKKLDKAYQLSGRDPREVNEYFEDPSHFRPHDWQRMQERKEMIEESITGLSKSDVKKKRVKQHVSKLSKDRKGKTLGARKNWLSMR